MDGLESKKDYKDIAYGIIILLVTAISFLPHGCHKSIEMKTEMKVNFDKVQKCE